MKGLINALKFMLNHPLNRNNKSGAVIRFIKWQIASRLLRRPVLMPLVDNTSLLISKGMTGATGSIYTGLLEFEDMTFILHAIRDQDMFIDVGANIGIYSILAASKGADCIAIEPIPETFKSLIDNVNVNGFFENITTLNLGIGDACGKLKFTSSLDTVNHALSEGESNENIIEVNVEKLDEIIKPSDQKIIIKIDVEGFESKVIDGAEGLLKNQNLQVILMELNGSSERYGFDESVLHKKVIDAGFHSYKYVPFSRKLIDLNNSINSESGNTIYIRDIDLITDRVESAKSFSVLNQTI